MVTVPIFCLANSDKHQGRCVAGLANNGYGWIRPVSDRDDGTLFAPHYQLENQDEPRLLDIIAIDLVKASPKPHHPENWLITNQPWKLLHRFDRHSPTARRENLSLLQAIAKNSPYLFNDFEKKIKYSSFFTQPASASLVLIQPENLTFKLSHQLDKWTVKASFTLQNCSYCLPVTDPVFKQQVYNLSSGSYPAEALPFRDLDYQNIFLTISLSEPFEDYCYKLVAAVIFI